MKIFLNALWVVGLLIWSCCFAMGFNYGHGDSLLVSMILLVSVLLIMGISIFFLNKWSTLVGKTATAKEIACLVTYLIMALLTVGGVAHFIAVQTDVKTEVRPKALSRIQELRRVFGNDNKEGSYQSYVSELAGTYRNQMKKDYADEGTVDLAVSEFEDEMMGEGEYERLKDLASTFLNDCEQSVDLWIPWTVTEYLSQLDNNTVDWSSKLVALSSKNEWVKTTGDSYNPHLNADEGLADLVKSPKGSDFGVLPIIIIIILQIIILFSYLRSKDWSQSGPVKHKSKNGGPVVYDRKHKEGGKRYQDQENNIEEV